MQFARIRQCYVPVTIRIEHNELLLYRGDTLPLVRLARRFGLAENTSDAGFAFIVGSGRSAVGIAVDRLIGKREIVVRPIKDPLAQAVGVAAATELGDGRVVLILDTPALIGPIALQSGARYDRR